MNNQFKPSQDSLDRLNNIFRMMREKSFHNHYHILFDLRSSIDKEVVTYLEIGAYAGGSASLMASHPQTTNVYSIDLGKPIVKEVVYANIETFKNPDAKFHYFEGDSSDPRILHQITEVVKKVDILFIDGDHTKAGVIKDFHNYKEFVNEGGYIVFDDYMDWQYSPEVKMAVDHIIQTEDMSDYTVIGSLAYPELEHTNYVVESSNEFILQKKVKNPVVNTDKSYKANIDPNKAMGEALSKVLEKNQTAKINPPSENLSSNELIFKGEFETKQDDQSSKTQMEDKLGFPIFVLESKLRNLKEKEATTENKKKIVQLNRSITMLKMPFA